jgi:rhamnose utilization protein RhaD (predicted bifunctional aldolase and dehydrogenase)/NAD(P)-dependent dehydrogenase (short-subunit alcohol dehydrogenase family)
MKSLWNDVESANYQGDLAQRVYTSRLLGRDKSLVMHGGGNTSVKITETNIVGDSEELLYVKGSGWDLETIEPAGFSPVRLSHLLKLAKLDSLSDSQMANELKISLTRASAPMPSVEAILHAILPHKFVDHTHADAIISITNTANGADRVREIYGNSLVIIPYVMPGFKLARVCAQLYPAMITPQTVGMVLLNHGLFTFGTTARESYERMIEMVTRAEAYLEKHSAWSIAYPNVVLSANNSSGQSHRQELAELRQSVSDAAGFPLIMAAHRDTQSLTFVRRTDLLQLSQQGPATPDHVIRTRRVPLIGRAVQDYRKAYEAYFAQNNDPVLQLTMLDPAPRIILDAELGLITIGQTAKDAAIAEDIYRHTIDIILRSEALGGWQALPASDYFDVEYWELEQAKIKSGAKKPVFTGEIALVTGAASGIGKACADSMLARGAAVVGLDLNPSVETLYQRPDFLGIRCDVTDENAINVALDKAVTAFGGLDMIVLNAGIFPASRRIEALTLGEWQKVMRVNLDSNLSLLNATYPLLKVAPNHGRVLVIGSKNVPAPGPGAAAYSASKAALNQLARIAALEWGADGIRVNIIHPNAVFDTGLWTDELLKTRAENYKMSVDEYKRNNILRVLITSHDVGELAAEMCGAVFARTTGAQVPIDGGNERVI